MGRPYTWSVDDLMPRRAASWLRWADRRHVNTAKSFFLSNHVNDSVRRHRVITRRYLKFKHRFSSRSGLQSVNFGEYCGYSAHSRAHREKFHLLTRHLFPELRTLTRQKTCRWHQRWRTWHPSF